MRIRIPVCSILAILAVLAANKIQAATYAGNGDTGFGGAIGAGTLTLTDDGTTVFGSLSTGATIDNALVLYIQSAPGGFSSTAGFNDSGDQLRSAISGYTATGNGGGPGQSVMTFASGFAPNYAIALQPDNGVNFGGMWQLANGGANSLPFVTSVNLSPTGTDAQGAYTFSFSLASIGLTPGAGQSFELFGTLVSDSGYRSTEAIAGNDVGTQGWNPFSQTAFATYTTTLIPEPGTISLMGLFALGAVAFRRKK